MFTLVANLGSTSFKHKLYRMGEGEGEPRREEQVLASGSADRIGGGGGGGGGGESAWSFFTDGEEYEGTADLPDHAAAIDLHLRLLVEHGVIDSLDDIDAVGFKAVHGGPIRGAVLVDDEVIATMRRFSDIAPAHNPPYIAAMEAFAQRLPGVPRVAAFETAFHQTIPKARQVYAIPWDWTEELGIRRYGFHGASHRYIAHRMLHLDEKADGIISFHLGGSSSVCAIRDGQSIANSFGLTPQSGLPHNNRVGDLDVFALQRLLAAGIEPDEILRRLSKEGGLLGISGVSGDLRDIEAAASRGNERACLALDHLIEACRHYAGAYCVALGGADAICFTGGIGQHSSLIREEILRGLEFLGLKYDRQKNAAVTGRDEERLDAKGSRIHVWVLPTNEELIVARQTRDVINPDPSIERYLSHGKPAMASRGESPKPTLST